MWLIFIHSFLTRALVNHSLVFQTISPYVRAINNRFLGKEKKKKEINWLSEKSRSGRITHYVAFEQIYTISAELSFERKIGI